MYLADRMLRVSRSIGEGSSFAASANIAFMVSACRRIIDGFDLFAFERSALAAASDLRIDTPERLEAVFEAVLRRPRRVFVEVLHRDRAEILSGIRGFPVQDVRPEQSHPQRVGLAIDVLGDGRARIEVLWNFAPHDIAPPLLRSDLHAFPKRERDAILDLSVMGVAYNCIEIDLSMRSDMTRAAFEMLVAADLPRGQRFGDLFRAARYIVGPGAGLAWRRRIVTEAWRLVRLNDYCRMDLVDGALLAASEVGLASGRDPWQVIGDTRSDLDGEVIHGVAMLALLEIETPDIEYKLRVPPRMLVASGRHRCGRASSVPEDRTARLAIVTVNFSDTALERAYSCNSKPSEGARPGRPRARHMVRGHLFRARNGKMVYRRPHWRGSAIGPVLHRVRR